MIEQYGIQQIDSICIKATCPTEIGGKWFGPNEVILYLKDVEAGKLVEENTIRSAEGGQYSPRLIQWITHNNVNFLISKGVLSKRDFNFLLDSDIIIKEDIPVSFREELTASSEGIINLTHLPQPGIYCYDSQGNKIKSVTVEGRRLYLNREYKNQQITVDYSFLIEQAHVYSIRNNFLSNIVVKAEIQFLLKDDNDGEEYTGILTIPTANIVGDINLIMGKKATPIVGDFAIQSVQSKTESRNERSNYTLQILDRDINEI